MKFTLRKKQRSLLRLNHKSHLVFRVLPESLKNDTYVVSDLKFVVKLTTRSSSFDVLSLKLIIQSCFDIKF
jgi:hypothetical protein